MYRSTGAGMAWFAAALAFGVGWDAFKMLLFPVVYFSALLPIGLFAAWLGGLGVAWAGLFALPAFAVIVGDPLIFFVSRLKPGIIPIEKPGFLNFKSVVFILDEMQP